MNQTLDNLKIIREQLGREIGKHIKYSQSVWFMNMRKGAEFLDVAIKVLEKYKE